MLPEIPSLAFQPLIYEGGISRFHLPPLYDLVAWRRPRRALILGFGDAQMHFAICQALREQQISGRCLTIRRFLPDESATDDEAWQKALGNNEEFFATEGQLLASDPLALAADWRDEPVDLLLIDDCDSGETLRNELRAWRNQLAPQALILAHGLALDRDDAPRAAWEEFCRDWPTHVFSEGIGLGLTTYDKESLSGNSLGIFFQESATRADLHLLYQTIVARIDACARVASAERENSTLRLRQIWLDTLLHDRWKAQEVMDNLQRDLENERGGGSAFVALRADRAKAQLVMDAQAEQLRQWVVRGEALREENKKLKALVAEQKRILNRAKKACKKNRRCFGLSAEDAKKQRRSIPQRILRELQRIPANLGRGRDKKKVEPGLTKSLPPIDRYAEWISQNEPDTQALTRQKHEAAHWKFRPKVSLLLPIFNPPIVFLEQLLATLAAQTYDNFEICAIVGGSGDPAIVASLENWQTKNALRLEALSENLGIAENTNRALTNATGDFIVCIDHDDLLPPFALYELARAITQHPEAEIFYSDEDRLTSEGKRHSPFFKPEWNPEYLLSSMYLGHITAYRRDLVRRVGNFRKKFDLSQDYDFALRASEQARHIVHVPHVLYHWREHPVSGSAGGKPDARRTNLSALAAAMERRKSPAEILEYPTANRARLTITQWPKVSIVIPTDSPGRGKFLVEELAKTTSYPDYEVLIVTNSALANQLEIIVAPNLPFRFIRFDEPFNFSAKCNRGARAATGTRLIFFNDDVESTQPDWIQNLIEPLQNPEIGAVAPKLLYETGKIQHAGLVTGVRGFVGTACHQWTAESTEYNNFAQVMRDCSALSGACLTMRTEDFLAAGEWDESDVPIAHSDLDLCFKIRAAGLRCVYTPFVTMRHRGHASIGAAETVASAASREKVSIFLLKRWPEFTCHDPYFPNEMRDWIYRDSPTPIRMWPGEPNDAPNDNGDLLFVSHDLSWSGAPLILFQLAQWCRAHGFFVTLMSPNDGPVRQKYSAASIPVVIDRLIMTGHESFAQFAREFDCVIASTIFGAPIVHAAKAAGVPHIWWLHEGRVAEHYLGANEKIRSSLGVADAIVIADTKSAQVYQPYTNRAIRVINYGINDPDHQVSKRTERAAEPVKFLLLGTIEQRKGQEVFLEALRKLPAEILARAQFQIIGRPHDFDLTAKIKAAAREHEFLTYAESVSHAEALALIREADVLISASHDETGPLILMEALALETPILATTVGCVAENLVGEEAGIFFPPGDAAALAAAIARLVREPDLRERLRRNSRAAYAKYFTFDRFADRFAKVIHEVLGQEKGEVATRKFA